jgi:hypothetical protein
MKLPRDLDGRGLVKALCRDWDYRVVNQEGSHIILQTESPKSQRISIPDHKFLRLGTSKRNPAVGRYAQGRRTRGCASVHLIGLDFLNPNADSGAARSPKTTAD